MKNLIRIGRVSSIDYENGMMEILYTDRDNAVTASFPYLSFNEEYKMPGIGQTVLVLHLSSGTTDGIVLGAYYNKKNKPKRFGKGIYFKQFGENSYLCDKDDLLLILGKTLKLQDDTGSITVAELLQMKEDIEALKTAISALGGGL